MKAGSESFYTEISTCMKYTITYPDDIRRVSLLLFISPRLRLLYSIPILVERKHVLLFNSMPAGEDWKKTLQWFCATVILAE